MSVTLARECHFKDRIGGKPKRSTEITEIRNTWKTEEIPCGLNPMR